MVVSKYDEFLKSEGSQQMVFTAGKWNSWVGSPVSRIPAASYALTTNSVQ